MPYLMSLEGPRIRHVDELRGQLYSIAPRPLWRASNTLGAISPYSFGMSPKLWIAAGVALGAYLAGSARGRALVAKFTKRS